MSDEHPEQLPAEPTKPTLPPASTYWPTFASLTPGSTYRFVTVSGYEYVGTFHTTYEDGCLCVYGGDPPAEGYVNPTTISVAWELDEG